MYKSVESLRIIAAFLVFLAHFPIELNVPILAGFVGGELFSGAIGVDIFFIISGFVIYMSASRSVELGLSASGKFVYLRLFRVLPLYMFITILYIFMSGNSYDFNTIVSSFLLIPFQDVGGLYSDPIVSLGWTLRFEMFFYSLVAIGITFKSILFVPVMLIMLSILLGCISGFYFGQSIIIEFLFGYLIGFYFSSKELTFDNTIDKRIVCFLFTLSISIILIVMTGSDSGYNENGVPRMLINFSSESYSRWIFWGGPSAILFILCILSEKIINWRIAELGKYTYSVYLWSIFYVAFSRIIHDKFGVDSTVIFLLACLGLAVTSYVSYIVVERSTMRVAKKVLNCVK
ncbi:acyltransferase family protein [Vibrio atlanticus]|uniref:acyltransferase family protein n=1 Tax=Vibrio atlanticus TaxID=693153 RepID=UPI003D0ACC52